MKPFTLKPNPVQKVCSKTGTDLYNYINACGLIQLVPSKDSEGHLCFAFTDLGMLTIYFEWGKAVCYHKLESGDTYITEYSMKGVFVADELESYNIEMFTTFF